jgi:flagellar basal-body rod protein FlgG
MLGQLEQQDAISNNLANVNTPGYKRVSVGFSAFSSQLATATGSRSAVPAQTPRCVIPVPYTSRDSSQGTITDTADPTNFAIEGPGCFIVTDGRTQELTRSGNFRIDNGGRLVSSDGRTVLGQNGPVNVSGGDWTIGSDGSVRVAGEVVDKLRIVRGPDDGPSRASDSSDLGKVTQGRLESSNVSTVKEMVNMLTALRSYEANQKVIQSLDQTLEKVINMPGRSA